jgi:hypothetical protein
LCSAVDEQHEFEPRRIIYTQHKKKKRDGDNTHGSYRRNASAVFCDALAAKQHTVSRSLKRKENTTTFLPSFYLYKGEEPETKKPTKIKTHLEHLVDRIDVAKRLSVTTKTQERLKNK